jgi:GTP pyrophosphokinase
MMVAMATDVRVILIKLADRLHNMRTLSAMPKQKQLEKARETLEIYAPLAHRLGIHAIKWELEDLSFQILHPRKYDDIKKLVSQQRAEREQYVSDAGRILAGELAKVGIEQARSRAARSTSTRSTRR